MMHTICKYMNNTHRNNIDEEIEIFKKVVEQGAAHFYEIASEGGLESA